MRHNPGYGIMAEFVERSVRHQIRSLFGALRGVPAEVGNAKTVLGLRAGRRLSPSCTPEPR